MHGGVLGTDWMAFPSSVNFGALAPVVGPIVVVLPDFFCSAIRPPLTYVQTMHVGVFRTLCIIRYWSTYMNLPGWSLLTFATLLANSADDKLTIFLIFLRKQDLNFFLANCLYWRQFAWNVKTCFWGKIKKNISICRLQKILPRVQRLKVNFQ